VTAPDPPDGEKGWGLLMPFVVCESAGGRYDDEAFVAGYQAGQIDQALEVAAAVNATHLAAPLVHAGLVEQLDLIAMRHGYGTVADETAPGWVAVTFQALQ
jgi:hypothetical protein